VGILLMLMTIGGVILATILLIISFLTKKFRLRKLVFIGVPLWFIFYSIMLFGFSLTSKERVLSLNEPKEFCGFYLDCHLHASVTGVRTAKIIGTQTAQGTFLIAKIKVFVDAKNPNIAFRLLEPKAEIINEGSRIYSRISEAENELPTAQNQLNQDIKGNQIIEKEIVFDITEPAKDLKLSITEGYGVDKIIEAVLVGDDDSIFHQPTLFKIETSSQTASVN
jgi:hypothetical protein